MPHFSEQDLSEIADEIHNLSVGCRTQEPTAETPLITTWHDKGEIVAEPSRVMETKSVQIVDKAELQATDLDSVAERILGAFKSEDDTRTDADLLAASGLKRDEYLDVRDLLLIETEEISETAEDTAPTEYVRNWPRKVEAAA